MTNPVSDSPPIQAPQTVTDPKAKSPSAFLAAGVILGWGVDLLFWKKTNRHLHRHLDRPCPGRSLSPCAQ